MIVSPRICPTPGIDRSISNSGRNLTRSTIAVFSGFLRENLGGHTRLTTFAEANKCEQGRTRPAIVVKPQACHEVGRPGFSGSLPEMPEMRVDSRNWLGASSTFGLSHAEPENERKERMR
jgi:hypothetical protein